MLLYIIVQINCAKKVQIKLQEVNVLNITFSFYGCLSFGQKLLQFL